MVNIGRNLVDVSTITLSGPTTFDNNSAYVGASGGTSGSLDGVIPQRGDDLA
ncbi:MAG: hypothetical protein H6668_19065 [Ardenticatenaceae bacterium]|nr:hypothetical protein [Ardenticatenaceae bacterium]